MRGLLLRLAVAAGIAGLVGVGVLLAVLPSPGGDRARSVFSTGPSGMRALFLLCESLGFRVEPWSEAPGGLAGPGSLLVLSKLPEEPDLPDAPSEEGEAAPRRGRDLTHYRRYVEEGGILLVLQTREEELDFLRSTLALSGWDDVESESMFELRGVARDVLFFGEERVELGTSLRHYFLLREPTEILARAEDGSALAISRAVGAGRVALASFPLDWLDNKSLAKDGEPALVFVRMLEHLAPDRVIRFDEYSLGGWRPEPVLALAFSPRLAWLSVHVLLLLLLFGWRGVWSGPFPCDPDSLRAASPLARARGFGRTLASAGRFDLLARQLRRGVLERWEARAGRRRGRDAANEGPDLEARLRVLARGDEKRLGRLREAFERAPTDERELTQLDGDLRRFEAELSTPIEKAREPVASRRS